ncbi:hypothetical protein JHK85_003866 [Glycine max]|nr:hypothetical protein JHK85_003866 [Glycine max]
MWSATSSPSIFLPHSLLRPLPRRPLCASLSWASPDPPDGLGGWALPDIPAQPNNNNKVAAFPSYAIVGFGTSLAFVLAVFAASRKGRCSRVWCRSVV